MRPRQNSVSGTNPGATAFTVTPAVASLLASDQTHALTAAFAPP